MQYSTIIVRVALCVLLLTHQFTLTSNAQVTQDALNDAIMSQILNARAHGTHANVAGMRVAWLRYVPR